MESADSKDSSGQKWGCIRSFIAILSVVIALFLVFSSIQNVVFWIQGTSPLAEGARRADQLRVVWAVLGYYHCEYGEWPKDLADLRGAGIDPDYLLGGLHFSGGEDFEIRFERLSAIDNPSEGIRVIVNDPGMTWTGSSPVSENFHRAVLLSNGRTINVSSLEEARPGASAEEDPIR